ncbi:fasciclin domain-containing protein [Labilibacter marinus]|uniref:fasciclin domain-containing protein n=1 Tax=Labilibacter marinus TaxID=1477105 RepID=UPI0008369D2A|nr:fasciclin domain-containing protein [Labilibacter marinus]
MKNAYSFFNRFIIITILAVFTSPIFAQENQNTKSASSFGFYTDPHYQFLNTLFQEILQEGPLTVFLPTKDAFENLSQDQKDLYFQHPYTELIDLLKGHMVSGVYNSNNLTDGTSLNAINENPLTISHEDHNIYVNDSKVVRANVYLGRSIIHFIDQVILPTTTVYDIIKDSEAHNTLETAINAAELDGALMGEGMFTVFAPTDDAFSALPAGTVEALLEDPTGDLAQILLYHVVGSKALSTDLSDGQMVETLQGQEVEVGIFKGKVTINGAEVVMKDIVTDNGVVHVIDAVILPPVNTSVDNGFAQTQFTVAPNPASTTTQVTFNSSYIDMINFNIYDATGKVVMQKYNYSSGEYVDVSSLSKGLYFIVIKNENISKTQKLMIR